jgi:hypothetical protein
MHSKVLGSLRIPSRLQASADSAVTRAAAGTRPSRVLVVVVAVVVFSWGGLALACDVRLVGVVLVVVVAAAVEAGDGVRVVGDVQEELVLLVEAAARFYAGRGPAEPADPLTYLRP